MSNRLRRAVVMAFGTLAVLATGVGLADGASAQSTSAPAGSSSTTTVQPTDFWWG